MKVIHVLFCFLIPVVAIGQIVDDSTKNVYSATTTLVAEASAIKNNKLEAFGVIDTSIYGMEQYDVYDQRFRRYQSLGSLGSPLFDLFYSRFNPDQPGRTLGMDTYDPYFPKTDNFRVYDTKSPFIDLGVILAGANRTTIDISFSRNINDHWNVGFDTHRITADKQNGLSEEGDRRLESSIFDVYSFYEHPSEKYDVLVSISNMVFDIAETGGVTFSTSDSLDIELFQYEDAQIQLRNATSQDRRFRVHLMQQFKLGSGFQLYHEMKFAQQAYKYADERESSAYDLFYPGGFLTDSTGIDEKTEYQSFDNEAGLKGNIGGVFYRFFAMRRALQYNTTALLVNQRSENYVGAYLRLNNKRFTLEGDGMLSVEGAYNLRGSLGTDVVQLDYRSSNRLPTFLDLQFAGNHHDWTNDFSPVFLNEFEGRMKLGLGAIDLQPFGRINTVTNYIYYQEFEENGLRKVEPFQANAGIFITELGGDINASLLNRFNEGFRLDNRVVLSNVSGGAGDVVRLPAFSYAGRLFWEGQWFRNSVPVNIGFNVFARSGYFGHQYDPVIQQFYVQDDFELKSYVSADFFLIMDILNLSLMVKVTHVNQATNDGYMASPYYPGQRRTFDLGVRWLFFD